MEGKRHFRQNAAVSAIELENVSRLWGETRALDGMQTDSWGGMTARWTYHPDNGMNITFTDAK